MHVHVSALSLFVGFLGTLIFGFLWRFASMGPLAESNLGKAMAFIY